MEIDDLTSKAIQNNEQLSYFGRDVIIRMSKALMSAGFSSQNCIKIIDKYPEILYTKPRHIQERLEMWHITQFSPAQFYELFVQCPELLSFDDEQLITKRFTELKEIVRTPKNIWRLLMSSPNVLVDDMQSIQAKVDYILNEMEADVTDFVKSGSLGRTLNEIKCRHVLLKRLGIYKKRNRKASELDPNKNVRLARIMDVSNEQFASKVCRISMKEFETFCELYERELAEKEAEMADYEELTDDEYDDDDEQENNFDPRERSDYYDDRHRRAYDKHHKKK